MARKKNRRNNTTNTTKQQQQKAASASAKRVLVTGGLELEQELEKPLLPPPCKPSPTTNGDEEQGGAVGNLKDDRAYDDTTDHDANLSSNDTFADDGASGGGGSSMFQLVCGNCRCRKSAILVSVMDLIITFSIAYFRFYDRTITTHNYHYTFGHSLVDVLCLTLIRAVLVIGHAAFFDTTRMAKIVGYTALMSFLLLVIKACAAIQWHHEDNDNDTPNTDITSSFAVIIIITSLFALLECFAEFFIGIFSSITPDDPEAESTDTSYGARIAPTVDADAEGINVGETKSIGMLELLKVLRPYFWPDGLDNRICVFFTWIFLIISKISNIAAPLFIAKATDDLSTGDGKFTATMHIAIYTILLLANKAFKEAQALSYIRVKLIAGVQLQTNVFSHLLTLSMDWHQRKSTGAVITAMQRGILASNTVVQYLFLYLFPTFVEAIVVCCVFVGAFHAPMLAACAAVGVILYIAITIELTIWRMQFRKKMNKANNDASHKATDSLLNFETVKYFTAEEHEVKRYQESVDLSQNQAYKIQGSLSMLNTAQQVVLNGTLVAALLVAANEYRSGDFTIGQFVAVNVYVIQLFSPLNYLGSIYGFAVGAYVDLQNLCNLLAEKPDVEDRDNAKKLCAPPPSREERALARTSPRRNNALTTNTNKPLKLEFRNVSFAYPSRKEVLILNNISFTVPAGSTTAIVGETGSGKSTVTRLLFRFYEADGGRVLVGGQDVMDLTQTSLREHLGAVPQDHALFNDTLEYNVRYGSSHLRKIADADGTIAEDESKGRAAVDNAIKAAQLTDFISSLPDGLQTKVGERGQQVSGGQKQRIAIARVLLKDAPVLILDEATSSLDSGTEEQIQLALFGNKFLAAGAAEGDGGDELGSKEDSLNCNLRGRKTMLVIAHRLSTIQDADQILVMAKGEVLERGTHEELLAKGVWHDRCYASLWDKQRKAE
eukprot:CAMPEP_0198252284 /NCGR_PEP_ID=MMETSP1447-20131203/2801_1 /TAXON_ID=420782 /ORGANISM="Chaetoceros dichaeta, Strain CCMP1751" /LENGTH=946 /DNA_ID=CAMNT_0043937469 /DNA_START=155 /DNA_END=2995 /DNA_ORIENTATION=-